MRRPFVAGNWKMNTLSASAKDLAAKVASAVAAAKPPVDVMVAPPFPYLASVGQVLSGSPVQLGAQNAYSAAPGAFTGEVAVEMLLDVGCRWAILGHSERRHVLHETDADIVAKVRTCVAKGLGVVLCVGELLAERQADRTEAVLDTQLAGGLEGIDAAAMSGIVIAYEPVWAIGTGVVATPDQAQAAHAHVRRRLSERYGREIGEAVRILYGGSVKGDNAGELLSQPDVDGALVGGASLKAESFLPIVEAAARLASGG
jgi:triosephosphate isomerase